MHAVSSRESRGETCRRTWANGKPGRASAGRRRAMAGAAGQLNGARRSRRSPAREAHAECGLGTHVSHSCADRRAQDVVQELDSVSRRGAEVRAWRLVGGRGVGGRRGATLAAEGLEWLQGAGRAANWRKRVLHAHSRKGVGRLRALLEAVGELGVAERVTNSLLLHPALEREPSMLLLQPIELCGDKDHQQARAVLWTVLLDLDGQPRLAHCLERHLGLLAALLHPLVLGDEAGKQAVLPTGRADAEHDAELVLLPLRRGRLEQTGGTLGAAHLRGWVRVWRLRAGLGRAMHRGGSGVVLWPLACTPHTTYSG